jgi:hypothetical protein
MRAWLLYLVLITLAASFTAVWQYGFHGVDLALIVKPPPRRIAPPDVTKRVSIQARQQPLHKVLAEFARQTEVTIEFDASALAMPGMIPTAPIDFEADNLPVDQAVEMAVGTAACEVRLHEGKLLVVDPHAWDTNEKVEPRVYPLGPLLAEAEGLSAETLAEALNHLGETFDPDSSSEQHTPQQLPAALLVTEKPRVHAIIEELLAALRRPRPVNDALQQAHWVISPFAPSAEILERLEEPVVLDLVDVPASQLAQELERQWKLPVRSQHAVTNTSKWLNGTKFTLQTRQKPMQEVLDELSSGQKIGWAPHGEVLWLFDSGNDVLEADPSASVFPVGDLLAGMAHARAPLARSEFVQWLTNDSFRNQDSSFLLGDSLVIVNDRPRRDTYVDDQLRSLRRAVFGGTEHAFDWRAYVAINNRLKQPLTVVCDQPQISARFARLAELSGVAIEFDPTLDRETLPLDFYAVTPFGDAFADAYQPPPASPPATRVPEPIPPWNFAQQNLSELEEYVVPLDLMMRRKANSLAIVPRRDTPAEDDFHGSHSIHALLTAAGDRLTPVEIGQLLSAVSRDTEIPPARIGGVFRLTGTGYREHSAVAEMLEKLCEHARRPDDHTPWTIESMESSIRVYPIGDVRESFARMAFDPATGSDAYHDASVGSRAGEPIGDYLVCDAQQGGEPAYAERLLAAFRSGNRQATQLTTEPIEKWQTRGVVLCDKWYRGFGRDSSFLVLYQGPELTRLNQPLVESHLPQVQSSEFASAYQFGPFTRRPSAASNACLWRNFGRELTQNGRECALEALVGLHAGGDGYTVYGDHVAVMATAAAQARFERRWQRIVEPEVLPGELPTVTLQAKDETLLSALDRWSRAQRRPMVILDADGVRAKLEATVALEVQNQPLAQFVREHMNDESTAADPIEVRDDDCALLIGSRSELQRDPTGITRLLDWGPLRHKLPEIDGRQLVQLLVELTDQAAWNTGPSNDPRAGSLFKPRVRSLTPVGDMLIIRQREAVVAQIEIFLQRLASDEIDRLPRPALLFADDNTVAVKQYLTALTSPASDDFLHAYAAFWLTECASLDAAQLAPLIDALALLEPASQSAKAQAICRVLAAHRGSARAALKPLVMHLEKPAPPKVHETLLAALACLGEEAIIPLAQLLPNSHAQQSQQIIGHVWRAGDAAAPAVPHVLEWAFLTPHPDALACCAVFSDRGGLLVIADPDATRTRAVVASWASHADAKHRQAYKTADKFFQQWPAYQGNSQQINWELYVREPPFAAPINNAFWEVQEAKP